MHTVLQRLSPAERTSFVLHDVFQYSFDEVATIVGRSPASCRQLASRARRALRSGPATDRFSVEPAAHRQLSERFIEACSGGDLEGLLALLDPAVQGTGDVVSGVLVGATHIAPAILRYLGPPAAPTLVHLPVGGRVGIVALRDRRVLALVVLKVDNGLVVHIDALAGRPSCGGQHGARAALSCRTGPAPGPQSAAGPGLGALGDVVSSSAGVLTRASPQNRGRVHPGGPIERAPVDLGDRPRPDPGRSSGGVRTFGGQKIQIDLVMASRFFDYRRSPMGAERRILPPPVQGQFSLPRNRNHVHIVKTESCHSVSSSRKSADLVRVPPIADHAIGSIKGTDLKGRPEIVRYGSVAGGSPSLSGVTIEVCTGSDGTSPVTSW